MSDTTISGFLLVLYFVMFSKEYRSLKMSHRSVLDALVLDFRHSGNGELKLTRDMAEEMWLDLKTRKDGLKALVEAGIIMQTQKRSGSKAEKYAVFWRLWGVTGSENTLEVLDMFKECNRRQRRYFKQYADRREPALEVDETAENW